MKILLVHNTYRQKGGEDMVFADERSLLEAAGHEVRVYLRSNDELEPESRASVAAQSLWSRRSHAELDQLFSQWRPDVMHVHNVFYALSGSVYWAAAKHRVAVVQTLHNFRLLCLQATFFREGQVCEDCLGRTPLKGVMRACHQGSLSQSLVLGASIALHRGLGTWRDKVYRYICLNEFSRQKFIEGGLDASKLVVKPNFAPRPKLPRVETASGGLYIGRLSDDKGVTVLARAIEMAGVTGFTVAGAGPADAAFKHVAAQLVGWQSASQLEALLARSSYVVIPSQTYEQFPRVLAEAFAFGVPVIASALGPLATLVQHQVSGLHFRPGDPEDLARVLRWAEDHPREMAAMGRNALAQYEAEFSPETNLAQLIEIYQAAVASA